MNRGRRGRTQGELWSGADRRALGYIRLRDGRGIELARHLEALEHLCHEHGTMLADVAVDVAPPRAAGAPPGLAWVLARLETGEASVLAVRRLDHLAGAFADPRDAARWLHERSVILVPSEDPTVAPAPNPAVRIRRGVLRSPGVGPRSWARYLQARTQARVYNC